MTFQEIHRQFTEAARADPTKMEDPLVVVFVKVILELSAAGIQIEKRVTELEAELEGYQEKSQLEWERSRDERF